MNAFEAMNKNELEAKLKELKELLEEVEEERGIILGQQNIHLSSKLVNKYARELGEISTNIELVENLLQSK